MKRKLLSILVALFLICTVGLISCDSNISTNGGGNTPAVVTPYIGTNGNWWVDNVDTGVSAQGPKGDKGDTGAQGEKGDAGENGKTPYIGSNGNWWVDMTDLKVPATGPKGNQGQKGEKGEDGEDGDTPFIGYNGNWWVGTTDLKVPATGPKGDTGAQGEKGDAGENGKDGDTPYIGDNGNWWIGTTDTGVVAKIVDMDRVGTDGLMFRMTIRGGYAGYEVYDYEGTETDVVIPNTLFNEPVISIVKDVFSKTSLTSLSISSNTKIVPSFEDYTALTSFDFNGADLENLPTGVFRGCKKLTSIGNYENVQTIPDYAFYESGMLNINNFAKLDFSQITNIGAYAFKGISYNSDLIYSIRKYIYLPETVKTIGEYAFSGLSVYYGGSSCDFSLDDEYYQLHKNVKKNDGYYYIDNGLDITIVNYYGTEKNLVIPHTIDNKPVKTLAYLAFETCHVLETVQIPNSVEFMNFYTFGFCKNLIAVFIPNSIKTFGGFYSSPKFAVFFESDSISYIEPEDNEIITDPEDLGIKRYAMNATPNDVFADDVCIYVKTTLYSISVYDVVAIKEVEGEITIPATVNGLPVSRIKSYTMYYDTPTTIVNVSNGISRISSNAFYYNQNLKVVNLPKSVEAVNHYGFYNLSNCTVYIEANALPSEWDSSWYYNIAGHKLNSRYYTSADGNYSYDVTDGKVYLIKYFGEVTPNSTITVPTQIDGKPVYGVRTNCYVGNSSSSNTRYSFVIPNTITVMESSAISLSNRGYANLFLYYNSSSEIPSTWDSNWFKSINGYSSYGTKYYYSQWEMLDGVPTVKQS